MFEDEGHDASAHLRGEETSAETGGAEHAAPAEAWTLIMGHYHFFFCIAKQIHHPRVQEIQ